MGLNALLIWNDARSVLSLQIETERIFIPPQ